MAGCGFTPAEIDEMTLADVRGLLAYWETHPPVHDILRAVYRIEVRPAATAASGADPSGIGGLIARFPDGHIRNV
jgi:hypothetical protein